MSGTTPSKSWPFLWGAATSAHQVEGNNLHSDWWHWESEGHIEGGVRSGRAADHWTHYKEDLRLAREMGLNSYRFSIEWAKLEPEEGKWDQAAIDWYRELIAECERQGLLPMATLHHFTSPQWFALKGGFTWEESPQKFSRFVEKVIAEFGHSIPLWCTLNEPMVLVTGTYLATFMPPARFSPQSAALACHHLLASHVAAYDLIHSKVRERRGPWKDHPMLVGIAHNMIDFMPDRYWHPIERLLSWGLWRYYNQSWLDAIAGKKQPFGLIGLVPKSADVKAALGRVTADFIGVNYYTKAYVTWRPRDASAESRPDIPVGITFARRKERASDLKWALHPQGLGKMLRRASKLGVPIYITENGIADRDDVLRPEYLSEHLKEVATAIADGMDIRGYYHWSLIDNFEWIKGFGPRFGLLRVDYSNFQRSQTRSSALLRKIILDHQKLGRSSPTLEVLPR